MWSIFLVNEIHTCRSWWLHLGCLLLKSFLSRVKGRDVRLIALYWANNRLKFSSCQKIFDELRKIKALRWHLAPVAPPTNLPSMGWVNGNIYRMDQSGDSHANRWILFLFPSFLPPASSSTPAFYCLRRSLVRGAIGCWSISIRSIRVEDLLHQ